MPLSQFGEYPVFSWIYASLGEDEQALKWLEQSYQDGGISPVIRVLPDFDPLRDDPRFTDLRRLMNLGP